jgi:fructose-1,6-bisphosphatase II
VTANRGPRGSVTSLPYDIDAVLCLADLVQGDNWFRAVIGIGDCEVLRRVPYGGRGATTGSLMMRSTSGTPRRIDAGHRLMELALVRRRRV